MSKKVSIISRLKGLFDKGTGTKISQYNSEVIIIPRESMKSTDQKEYNAYEHFYVKTITLPNGGIFEKLSVAPEGYEFMKMVDHAGYEIDDLSTYQGQVYILFCNNVPVKASIDQFKIPGGLTASRYVGNVLEKGKRK